MFNSGRPVSGLGAAREGWWLIMDAFQAFAISKLRCWKTVLFSLVFDGDDWRKEVLVMKKTYESPVIED